MAIQLARYAIESSVHWGIVDNEQLRVLPPQFVTTADILACTPEKIVDLAEARTHRISECLILSPVTAPAQIICQGLNYADHSMESGHRARQHNLLFPKATSSLSGPYDPVVRPTDCRLLDYEVELGLVMRRSLSLGDRVSRGNLGDFVGGLVICNDISARDIMFGAPYLQWYRGKSARTFCPCGPWLLMPEPDELAGLMDTLELKLWLNGELREQALTRDMIFPPEVCLSEMAEFMDLHAGDLLLTGTPGGVIAQANARTVEVLTSLLFSEKARRQALVEEQLSRATYLKAGDVVRADIRTPDGSVFLGPQEFTIADPLET